MAMLKILESDAQVCTQNCSIIEFISLHKSFKFDEHYMYVPLAITDANECEIDPDINLR